MNQNTESPDHVEPVVGAEDLEESESKPEINVLNFDPKDNAAFLGDDNVDIELDHFMLTNVPPDPSEVGGGHLAMTLALLSEILELKKAVFDLADALVEDRKRIRRMERQSNAPGMGGFGGAGIGLMPTPLARATANGEPDPEHLKTVNLELDVVREMVQSEEGNDEA